MPDQDQGCGRADSGGSVIALAEGLGEGGEDGGLDGRLGFEAGYSEIEVSCAEEKRKGRREKVLVYLEDEPTPTLS